MEEGGNPAKTAMSVPPTPSCRQTGNGAGFVGSSRVNGISSHLLFSPLGGAKQGTGTVLRHDIVAPV